MLPELEKLLVVQDRDTKIKDLQRDIERIPQEGSNAEGRLADDQAAVMASKEAVQNNEVGIKNLELEVETCKQTVIRLKTQQFETKKNEEFSALGHEIERYDRQIVELEDRELELMEKAETLKATHKETEAKLVSTQSLVNEELEKLKKRQLVCQEELDALVAERKTLAERVDPTIFSLYDRMKRNKDNVIVRLDDHSGMCGGCHMKVTPTTVHKARAESEIAQCEQCSRLLYVIDVDA